ncbi:unnamed protein product [Caretta caretta]
MIFKCNKGQSKCSTSQLPKVFGEMTEVTLSVQSASCSPYWKRRSKTKKAKQERKQQPHFPAPGNLREAGLRGCLQTQEKRSTVVHIPEVFFTTP